MFAVLSCRPRRIAQSRSALAAARAPPPIPQVEFDTTAGKIRVELYPDAAPKTVANFLDYVKAKHYDGTQFHRVIAGFMIQGGGFAADFKQKPTKPPVPIEAEQSSKAGLLERAGHPRDGAHRRPELGDRAVLHQRQRQQARSTSARPTPQGYGYTVFGKVVAGMDVVDKIAKTPTGAGGPFPTRRARRADHHQQGRTSSTPSKDRRPWSSCTPTTATSRSSSTPTNAPKTVANFLQYVRDGHYDNTLFHRVIDGFMIQGGGMEPGMKQKPTRAPSRERGRQRPQEQALHGRDGAHVGSAFGHRAVLHQRRRQRLPRLHGARRRRAGATACSARSSRARTSSTRSRACPPAAAASTRTCRARTS